MATKKVKTEVKESNQIEVGDLILYKVSNFNDKVKKFFGVKDKVNYNIISTTIPSTTLFTVITPNKKYSAEEKTKFAALDTQKYYMSSSFNALVGIINSVRPKTFVKEVTSVQDLLGNKYYKEKKIM